MRATFALPGRRHIAHKETPLRIVRRPAGLERPGGAAVDQAAVPILVPPEAEAVSKRWRLGLNTYVLHPLCAPRKRCASDLEKLARDQAEQEVQRLHAQRRD